MTEKGSTKVVNNDNNPTNTLYTRICIKNVPINFTEEKLTRYLQKQKLQKRKDYNDDNNNANNNNNNNVVVVTDCCILKTKDGKSRKLAFVGFKNHDMAQSIVIQLNKTFILTSKIIVEPAFSKKKKKEKKNDDTTNDNYRPWSKHSEGSSRYEQIHNKKQQQEKTVRKISDGDDDDDEIVVSSKNKESDETKRRKNEFLSAMGLGIDNTSSSKTKFWSNDDVGVVGEEQIMATSTAEEKNDIIDQEFAAVHQNNTEEKNKDKGNNSSSDDDDDDDDDKSSVAGDDDDNDDDDDSSVDIEKVSSIKPAAGSVMTDMDFFKSKVVKDVDGDDDDDDLSDVKETNTNDNKIDDNNNNNNDQSDSSDSSDDSSSSSDSDSDDDTSTSSDDDDDEQKGTTTPNQMSPPVGIDDNNNNDDDTENDDIENKQHFNDNNNNLSQISSTRLFVRNVPFTSTEDELREYVESFLTDNNNNKEGDNTVLECHIPVDDQKHNKGYAFITLNTTKSTKFIQEELDGADFQGRILHILPARKPPRSSFDDDIDNNQNDGDGDTTTTNLTYKQKMELQRKKDAVSSNNNMMVVGANASFVRGDAVVDNLSDRLGIKKGDLLNVKDGLSSGDAAVRLALGETHIIEENRSYFRDHGIDMDAMVGAESSSSSSSSASSTTGTGTTLSSKKNKRSNTMLLVKNLPYDATTHDDLTKLFHCINGCDEPKRILLPPSRTIALVEYGHTNDANRAYRKLAYKRFKHVPIYLEWAPISSTINNSNKDQAAKSKEQQQQQQQQLSSTNNKVGNAANESKTQGNGGGGDDEEDESTVGDGVSHTIYVKNLNFATTEDQLRELFEREGGIKGSVRAVKIPKKAPPTKKFGGSNNTVVENNNMNNKTLSMGYGFVECKSSVSSRKAMKALQGKFLNGHALELKPSTKQLVQGNNTKQQQQLLQSSSSKNDTKTSKTKLMVRNVPFQATRKELLQLFGSFGQLKKVRLPKKFDGTHRGFAFVEYLTNQEAQTAMNTLCRTHLYGRHLVLEWAAPDEEDMNTLRDKAKRDVDHTLSISGVNRQNKKIRFT